MTMVIAQYGQIGLIAAGAYFMLRGKFAIGLGLVIAGFALFPVLRSLNGGGSNVKLS